MGLSLYLAVVLALSLESSHSLSPGAPRQFRKSTLLPWNYVDDKEVLGHCVEERDEDAGIMTVRIWIENEESDNNNMLVLKFPENSFIGEGLASQFWPAAMASSILLRSPEFTSFVKGRDIVELGTGRGLAGLVAASNSKSCLLTDNDAEAVEILESATCPSNRGSLNADLSTRQLDWRDEHRGQVPFADIVLGSDIAYYWHLLRPIMDTSRAFMDARRSDANSNEETNDSPSTLFVVGQANRESLWDLYNNIKGGCYNQLTDEDEPPWPGTCRMLLYNLRLSEWCDTVDYCEEAIDGVIPISLIVHDDNTNPETRPQLSPFASHVHVATKEDDESIMKTF